MRTAIRVEFVQELNNEDLARKLGRCEDVESLGLEHEQD